MKSFKVKFLIYFTFVYLCAVLTGAGAQDYADDYYPKDAKENFSWNLIRNMFGKEEDNVVISPFNAKTLLAILADSAPSGTTIQNELYKALEFTSNSNKIHKEILTVLRKADPYVTLNLETKIYADQKLSPKKEYLDLLANIYGAGFEKILFGDAEASANKINSWSKNVTNGMLRDLVKPNDLVDNVLMFASVLYFNGLWSLEFEKATDGVFYTTPTTTRNVQYMHTKGEFFIYVNRSLNIDMLRLPYKGKNMSMFIILPRTKDGIEEVIKSLDNNSIKAMQSLMLPSGANVTLPKFKFEFETDLKKILTGLGIKKIFGDKTVLLGEELSFARIIQKSGIDVSEKGTKAYDAATAVIADRSSDGIFEFNVDHPFIFFIEEETTGSILFAGKVVEPFYK